MVVVEDSMKSLTPDMQQRILIDQEERHRFLFQPLCLWRNTVAHFGCRVIPPQKRWAGVQLGLPNCDLVNGGKQAGARSVYYDNPVNNGVHDVYE